MFGDCSKKLYEKMKFSRICFSLKPPRQFFDAFTRKNEELLNFFPQLSQIFKLDELNKKKNYIKIIATERALR